MFKPIEVEDAEYQLKPMNCPFHILIYADRQRSYRDLPVRLGELGTVYRYERSGVLNGPSSGCAGLQDDAHLLYPDQIENEVVNCLQFAVDTLTTFGFEKYEAELSLWDGGTGSKYDGTPEQWQIGENALQAPARNCSSRPR
jgi:threonyl-tRNA synthetase